MRRTASSAKATMIFYMILILAAALRLFRLDFQSFWNDEVVSIENTNVPFMELLTNSWDTTILPFYYFILHPFLWFENQEFWLRFPSVLCGVLSVGLFFLVVRRWFDERVSLTATLLLALSPLHIWYSQETRPYALLLLFVLGSVWLLQNLLAGKTGMGTKVLFVLAVTGTISAHPVGLAIIPIIGMLAHDNRGALGPKTWTSLFAVMSIVTVIVVFMLFEMQRTDAVLALGSFSVYNLPYTAWAFKVGYSLGPSVNELHLPNRVDLVIDQAHLITPSMILFAAVFTMGAIRLWREGQSTMRILATWLILPIAFAIIGSIFTSHPYNVRYAILAFFPFVIIMGLGICHIRIRWVRGGALSLLVLISLVSLHNYYFDSRYQRDDNRSAGQFLAKHALPGDVVLANAGYTARNLRHYTPRSEIHIAGISTESKDFSRLLGHHPSSHSIVSAQTGRVASLVHKVKKRGRFWLFLSRNYSSKGLLEFRFQKLISGRWQNTGLSLYLLPLESSAKKN